MELQERGEIQMLYDKWWKNPGDTCTRNEKGKESKANALGVDNIGGVFVVLLCGLAVAVMVAIFEFCYNSKRNTQAELVRYYILLPITLTHCNEVIKPLLLPRPRF